VGFSNKMARSLHNCELGVVRPATENYAKEAIEALKAEKVIVVPTDTIYGFACDAWYVI
jgi:tRNA A37 threonylcarbamoyladenosine synthetase subunit TsaC/SUA5/YrdC